MVSAAEGSIWSVKCIIFLVGKKCKFVLHHIGELIHTGVIDECATAGEV